MDLIFYNGKIITMDESNPEVSAAALSGGTIAALGRDEDVLETRTPLTRLIDLEGRLVLPGFHDSHMHLLNFGYTLDQARLSGCRSVRELIERGRAYIAEHNVPAGRWVLGRGWNQDVFEDGRLPSKEDLDEISTEHPVLFTRACGHIAAVNTMALGETGSLRSVPVLEGGSVDVGNDGVPVGIVRESGLDYIQSFIPNPKAENLKDMILRAQGYALRAGITSIGSDDFSALPRYDPDLVIRAFEELEKEGTLVLKVHEQCLITDVEYLEGFMSRHADRSDGGRKFRIGPLKLLADGSLGARTAFLKEDYHDDPGNRGIACYTQNLLDELIETAHRGDMQIAVHCIGDGALEMVFNSLDKAYTRWGRKALRHGIVHCQITGKEDLIQIKDRDLCAYVQPVFIDYDHRIVKQRVGKEKTRTSYNFKTLMDTGVHVSGGSDCPVEPCDVLPNIYCAVTRKGLDGLPEEGFLPDQKMSVFEAVKIFTVEGSYMTGEELVRGRIREGMIADVVVLDRDIFSIPPEEIKESKVVMTICGGEIVYNGE